MARKGLSVTLSGGEVVVVVVHAGVEGGVVWAHAGAGIEVSEEKGCGLEVRFPAGGGLDFGEEAGRAWTGVPRLERVGLGWLDEQRDGVGGAP